MSRTPAAVWIVDTNKEHLAVEEARKLRIPIVGILDSNCDPDLVDFPIPGNDDAIRAVGLLTRVVADAVAEGLIARSGAKIEGATVGAEEPLADWERELLSGDADKAAVEATGGDAAKDETPAAEGTGAAVEAPEAAAAAEAATEAPAEAKVEEKTEVKTEEAPQVVATVTEGEYGADSAAPLEDGSAPEGFEIKGNKKSMKFHSATSPWYSRTDAEVWFKTADAAEKAGFVNAEAKAEDEGRREGLSLPAPCFTGGPARRRGGATVPFTNTSRKKDMANFTAADVKKLRELTAAGMMDCKKALDEADGDFDKAVEILRVKGAAKAAKRGAEREASAGLVATAGGALVELKSETDFVAKNDDFVATAQQIADAAASSQGRRRRGPQGRRRSVTPPSARPSSTSRSPSARRSSSAGSPTSTAPPCPTCTSVPRTCPPAVGVLVEFDGDDADAARAAAMQIAAMRPQYLTRDEVPADVVAKEREIAEATAREEGKPEQAIAKIVEGRVNSFFKDVVLLEQPSVTENKKTVKAVLDEAGVTLTRFARFEVGA